MFNSSPLNRRVPKTELTFILSSCPVRHLELGGFSIDHVQPITSELTNSQAFPFSFTVMSS